MKGFINRAINDGLQLNMRGLVSFPELNKAYNTADLFVMPSVADGWGLVGLQALASGTFSLISSATGVKEAIVEGENGFVFESRNSDDLAEKIDLAIREKRTAVREPTEKWKHSFSWYAYGQNYIKAVVH